MTTPETDPGIIKALLAGLGTIFLTIFGALTGWHFRRIARVEDKVDKCVTRDEFERRTNKIESNIQNGFRGIHQRLDSHIDDRRNWEHEG